MPATTTREHQLARDRRKTAAYRARNKERAKEQTRRAVAKYRAKFFARPKTIKPAAQIDPEKARRFEIIRQRLKLIRESTETT